ncbi:hypothetical protein GCM10010109_40120 [Actinoplanes campanulatus]|nr:hypothetical protein GCM10010109_40120 [Actinoplanes campanulatus]GID39576.1 hypothetical protein Aca09nite_60820 [Actinoplanes campanulatus]
MLRRLTAAVAAAGFTLSLTACSLGAKGSSFDWDETVHTASGTVVAVSVPPGTVIDNFPAPPLAVDDTLRVTVFEHKVVAQPIDAPLDAAAHWSYERAGDPAVSDVRVVELDGRKLVVAGWDDGGLVALEALTGKIVWHAEFEPQGEGVITGRFNASSVSGYYSGAGFTTAGSTLLVGWAWQLAGYDLATGRKLWQTEQAGCDRDANWNPMGAFVVVDAGCETSPDIHVKVLDARTGAITSELHPTSWPQTPGSTGPDSVAVHGCAADGSDCLLLEHHNSDGNDYKARFYAMNDSGKLVATGVGVDYRGYAHVQGGGEMLIVDQPSDKTRWKVTGETRETGYQFGAFNHRELRPEDKSIWVSSPSWYGGDRLLAKLDAKTGRVLSCADVPTGKTVTYLQSLDDTHLITATYVEDPQSSDHAYALYLPKKRSSC